MNTLNEENTMEIPLGNSIFQIQNFIATGPPERKLRACILQLRQKEIALKECIFHRRRFEIDIAEIKEKLLTTIGYDKERLQIDLEEKEFGLSNEIDLIADCIVEIATYRKIIEDLPKVTRSDFENAEYSYWKERLLRDAKHEITSSGSISKGTIDALEQMGIEVGRNESNQIVYHIKQPKNFLVTDDYKKYLKLV